VGLVLLGLIWAVLAAFSRIPVIGDPSIKASSRNRFALVLSFVFALILLGVMVVPVWADWSAEGSDALIGNLSVRVVVAVIVGGLAAFAVVHLTSQRAVSEAASAVREGALWPVFIIVCVLSVFALAGSVMVFKPAELLSSVARLPHVGTTTVVVTIPAADMEQLGAAADPPQTPVAVDFLVSELSRIVFEGDQSLTIDVAQRDDVDLDPPFRTGANQTNIYIHRDDGLGPFESEQVNLLYIRNYGADDAHLALSVTTETPHPQSRTIPISALAVIAVFLLYIVQRTALPKTSAVALSTLKSEMAQPLFTILMMVGSVLVVLFIFIPYNTFGEDIKMLKDSGLTLIMVLCIVQAVWASSTSIADEIDGRTALTVLSKPIGRRSFIVGKFLGIGWTVAVMFIMLGILLLIVVAYKPIYDAKEAAESAPTWQGTHLEMISVVPGLVLAFLETLVLASLSVAISTRLPMIANFIICLTIYVLGHLTPLLVQSSVGEFEAVEFVANLLATVLPILDHFNIQAAIAAGVGVPYHYLGWSLVYCLIYGMIALLLALVLFEDRDLA
jgi:ABC-type transport system involved in multi-copper enzyme maturation permease subunit